MDNIINIEEYKKEKVIKYWNDIPECKIFANVPVPEGSYCIELHSYENYVIAIFEIPGKGPIPFKIHKNGICHEVE